MVAAPSRRIPFLPRPESEDDLHALLDELPEVAPKPPLPFPPADADAAIADEELAILLETVQAETQLFVAAQHARLRAQIAARTPGADAVELAQLRAAVTELRDENARLLHQLDLYERAFRTLKDLAIDVEEASREP